MKGHQPEGHSWSLFSSTALALIGSISVILVFTLSAVTWVVMVSMAKRSADDLAALIILSAQTWVELPHNIQPLLAAELKSQHGISIKEITTLTRQHNAHLPYVRFLHDAVVHRFHQCPAGTIDPKTGECIYIGALPNDAGYWLELPIADDVLKFEFSRERVGYKIPFTLGIILVSGILLTLIVGLWLTRRLTRPVSQLAEQVSRGLPDAPLPLTGPKETRVLIDAVNRRTAEVKQLLESRTILLAGISHDLRTPLTRLSLSLALAQDSIEPELHDQMQDDIGRMNRLIAEVLLIARGVNQASTERIALSPWLEQLAENARQRGVELELILPRHERLANIASMALQRILDNLIDNAHRYGAPPVVLRLVEQSDALVLCVEDQGEGLTESEIEQLMAPFARKDAARGGDAGYGLGLSLASALAESQHWRLELYATGRHPERAPAHRPTGLVACLILPNVVAERNDIARV